MASRLNDGFEANLRKVRDKGEILKRRKENDAIHSVSRFPLSPRNFDSVQYPNTLVRFKPYKKKVAVDEQRMAELEKKLLLVDDMEKRLRQMDEMEKKLLEMDDMKKRMVQMEEMEKKLLEMDDMKKRMVQVEEKLKTNEEKLKTNEEKLKKCGAAILAGHTVMIRFFTDYAYGAVTYGRNKKIGRVLQEASSSTITVYHSVEGDLPNTLDVVKHAKTLQMLKNWTGKLSNSKCHSGTIAGIAVAIETQDGIRDVLTQEELGMLASLFQDLFGICVAEAALLGDSPLYGKKLETQGRQVKRDKKDGKADEQ